MKICANILKRLMRINGVCEYTETCEYEENKIDISFDSLQSESKKSCECDALFNSCTKGVIAQFFKA
jgi:hypothetical protein